MAGATESKIGHDDDNNGGYLLYNMSFGSGSIRINEVCSGLYIMKYSYIYLNIFKYYSFLLVYVIFCYYILLLCYVVLGLKHWLGRLWKRVFTWFSSG